MLRGTAAPQHTTMQPAPHSTAHICVSYRLETSTRSPTPMLFSIASGLEPMKMRPVVMRASGSPQIISPPSVFSTLR